MAAAISNATGTESDLIRGGKGIFDVVVDGELVFSKYDTGRFPEDDEILSALPQAAPSASA